jgi:signal transduction histidine kinase
MGELIRRFDWSTTPLGPAHSWSPALRTTLRIILASRFPHVLWWGPRYIQFYNDPYAPIPGAKHPDRVLGRPASECWPEIWHVIGPLIDRPFNGGDPTWNDDILLEINRHGFLEESHFVIAYSPVPDEAAAHGIGGVLATVHEITGKVVGERRVKALRDLGARVGDAKTAEQACEFAADTLAEHTREIPFALLYLIDSTTRMAHLAGTMGVMREGATIAPPAVDIDDPVDAGWPFFQAVHTESIQIVTRLGELFPEVPPGPWSDPPHTAVVVPIPSNRMHDLAGLLVLGVSARLALDASYCDFFDLVRTQIATSIANARTYEEEKRRAEELAALDRAKTAFFSNVSHEFRTPLTLMLGPVEDLLNATQGEVEPAVRQQLEVVHRNGLRLLRLVNNLLDFSRIEAGRARATFQPTDLAAYTAELASVFRAAVERAGLRLVVDCPHLDEPVQVDREMWEKIVLNLLSNAYKFTFEGAILVQLRAVAGHAEVTVRDTGTGIPAHEIPRLFERFHRVSQARGRTHEGSGIGLALVQELVKLHGGSIRVDSVVDQGTAFTVAIPLGSQHLPAHRIQRGDQAAPAAGRGSAFVEEALRWLPEPADADTGRNDRERILVADDNADMRRYVARLLSTRYRVEAVADGEAALAAARRLRPALILTDVMMPRLDGFGLLRGIRGDESLREVPVIMLSARAGEESRVEGIDASADDYLVKPFSARELLARVGSHLKMARLRHQTHAVLRDGERRAIAAAQERTRLLESERAARAAAERTSRVKDEFLATLSHELRTPLNAILGWSQIMERGKMDAETIAEGVAIISRNARAQTRLIEDLLDMSRIVSGKLRLDVAPVNVAEVVAAAVEAVKPSADAKAIVVATTLDERAGLVAGDASRLQQVLGNLLTNAVKFTPRAGRVHVRLERADAHVEIVVSDTGQGIKADFLPFLFERFRQADASTTRRHGGLGIGLAVAKQIVELHGGTVRAESDGEGQGSTFTVSLPLAMARLAAAAPAADDELAIGPRGSVDLNGVKVLYVDDDADARLTGERILFERDALVTLAASAREALDLLRRERPDVLISDIGMPDLDGYELIRRVRELSCEEGGETPAAAVTAFARSEDRRRALLAGYQSHLAKPVEPEELITVVASLAGRLGKKRT